MTTATRERRQGQQDRTGGVHAEAGQVGAERASGRRTPATAATAYSSCRRAAPTRSTVAGTSTSTASAHDQRQDQRRPAERERATLRVEHGDEQHRQRSTSPTAATQLAPRRRPVDDHAQARSTRARKALTTGLAAAVATVSTAVTTMLPALQRRRARRGRRPGRGRTGGGRWRRWSPCRRRTTARPGGSAARCPDGSAGRRGTPTAAGAGDGHGPDAERRAEQREQHAVAERVVAAVPEVVPAPRTRRARRWRRGRSAPAGPSPATAGTMATSASDAGHGRRQQRRASGTVAVPCGRWSDGVDGVGHGEPRRSIETSSHARSLAGPIRPETMA